MRDAVSDAKTMKAPIQSAASSLSLEEILREVRSRTKLDNPRYATKFALAITDALCKALRDPDVEVRVTLDSVTELSEACGLLSYILVKHKITPLVDWDKSSDDRDCIEFLNGSALVLKGPKGDLCLKHKASKRG